MNEKYIKLLIEHLQSSADVLESDRENFSVSATMNNIERAGNKEITECLNLILSDLIIFIDILNDIVNANGNKAELERLLGLMLDCVSYRESGENE